MKKYFKYKIIGLVLLAVSIVSCETAEQDVSPIASPDNYPVATFTTDFTGSSITEGDTIVYTITLDKMIDRSLTFSADITGGTVDELDFISEPATIPPYSLETELMIIFTADNFPEVSETVQMEVLIESLAAKYLPNPSTVYPTLDLTVNSYNNPARLTVAFGWTTENDDIDLFAVSKDYGAWGAAASSDNPEIMMDVWPDDPDGTYYITIDPYDVEGNSFDYTFSIGHPDGSVEFFEGTFDMTALDTYTVDYFDAWDMDTYRLLIAVNNGGVFTITNVNE